MENIIFTLHDFMLHTKTITYVLMGVALVSFVGYWVFLTGREEKMRKY